MTSRCTTVKKRFPVNWRTPSSSEREANSQTDCNKIKYESDLWLYNRNLMKTLFRLCFHCWNICSAACEWNSAFSLASDASTNGCCCEVIREAFFSEVSCDSYQSFVCRARRIHIVHFPPPVLYLLPSTWNPFYLLLANVLWLVFKCQNSNNNNADDTMKEMERTSKKYCQETEGEMSYIRKSLKEIFRSQNYYAVM